MFKRQTGFTLVELLVVMAAIGLLLSVAAPRYAEHVDRAREVALKQNLQSLRETIEKFYSDRARYPDALPELVKEGYLRQIPVDTITDRADTWVPVAPGGGNQGPLMDVRSGATGKSRDGSAYAAW